MCSGPLVWEKLFPVVHGKRQSPINIEPAKCRYDRQLVTSPLEFKYDLHKVRELVNTGTSVQVVYDSENSRKLFSRITRPTYAYMRIHLYMYYSCKL